jgi:riboflavin synthase
MFTGIVRGLCPVIAIESAGNDFARLSVRQTGDMIDALQVGDSVAIDGVCLTACEIVGDLVTYDVIKSTLSRTIIGEYGVGRLVNVERSMKADGEVGGHEVSGHVDTTAVVETVEATPNNLCLFFRTPPQFGRYMFPRGFVAINGVSLTVSDCLEGGVLFSVWLIPETIRVTNLGGLRAGQRVNLEIHRGLQVVVDTIESSVQRFLQAALSEPESLGDRAKLIEGLTKLFLPRLAPPRDETMG